MSLKDLFNDVKTHMLKQGMKAIDEQGNCCYKTESGLKCAIGCLIPDELYDLYFEGKGVGAVVGFSNGNPDNYPVRNYLMNKYSVDSFAKMKNLLFKLQDIHDEIDETNWGVELDKLDKKFALAGY